MQNYASQRDMMARVKESLHAHGFEAQEVERSCFDLFARDERHLIALKVLHNVDSFGYIQALDLKKATAKMNAAPVLIGCVGRNFELKENCVYERFDVPAMRPETFENTLENINPLFLSKKGQTVNHISGERMRQLRSENDISLEELSRHVDLSKKTLYLAEKHSRMSSDSARKVEMFFSESITKPIDVFAWKTSEIPEYEDNSGLHAYNDEKKAINCLSRAGFDCTYLKTAPMKVINAFEDKIVLSAIVTGNSRKKQINDLKNISEISQNKRMIINLSSGDRDVSGVASFSVSELRSIASCEELLERICERERESDGSA